MDYGKEIFIYNKKDLTNPGQITAIFSKGAFNSKYIKIKFVRTNTIEYVNICDMHFDYDKNAYVY